MLAFIGVVVVFCLFFIRRQVLEYRLDHTFTVHDPEFFGSALALANPIPLPGNKIALLENGDEYFPAMLSAIRFGENDDWRSLKSARFGERTTERLMLPFRSQL